MEYHVPCYLPSILVTSNPMLEASLPFLVAWNHSPGKFKFHHNSYRFTYQTWERKVNHRHMRLLKRLLHVQTKDESASPSIQKKATSLEWCIISTAISSKCTDWGVLGSWIYSVYTSSKRSRWESSDGNKRSFRIDWVLKKLQSEYVIISVLY